MHNEGMLLANAQKADKYVTAEHIWKQSEHIQIDMALSLVRFITAVKLFKQASPYCLDHLQKLNFIPLVP